jgi:hypothetical protein
MQTSSYDILRMDARRHAVWIESVSGLDVAKARVLHLAERFPADYVIFHRATVNVVAKFHFKHPVVGFVASPIAEESLSGS